jgi:hypothetical protein
LAIPLISACTADQTVYEPTDIPTNTPISTDTPVDTPSTVDRGFGKLTLFGSLTY